MRHQSIKAFMPAAEAPWAQSYAKPRATVRQSSPELNGIIRLLTCGSVDDGKSTLIGRLLWDASPLYDDQREKLLKETASLHGGQRPDFSRLVDGLIAEQEQGITIDIAWHYFDTEHRRVVIIDSPGHEQYTRNMATGASNADVAVLLVDAQSGIKRQTRRHLAILHLAGVRKVVLAINKMDLIGWSEERFNSIVEDFKTSAAQFPSLSWLAIPVSALNGDNVATRSQAMDWYSGPTFVEHLETVDTRDDNVDEPFRMPIQMVLRDSEGFRGVAGTITAGKIRTGDAICDALSGKTSRVSEIRTMDGTLEFGSKRPSHRPSTRGSHRRRARQPPDNRTKLLACRTLAGCASGLAIERCLFADARLSPPHRGGPCGCGLLEDQGQPRPRYPRT